jgi:hypothetical protein
MRPQYDSKEALRRWHHTPQESSRCRAVTGYLWEDSRRISEDTRLLHSAHDFFMSLSTAIVYARRCDSIRKNFLIPIVSMPDVLSGLQ